MNKKLNIIKNLYENDIIFKEIEINESTHLLFYLESLCSSDKINDYILKNLQTKNENSIVSSIKGPNTKIIKETEIETYLENGFAIIEYNGNYYSTEVRAEIFRSITTPSSEPSIDGPKDAFTENYQTNIGLIRRRIKTSSLKIENKNIGLRSKTNIGILYIDDIADKKVLKLLNKNLNNIDIDGIIDSTYLSLILEKKTKTNFPTIIKTERPDKVANALLEGKIAIVVDTSPYVLILPAFFIDFINPQSDNYQKNKNINFIKILRLICFFISIMFPAFYVAIINYNQEAIPTSLLINFAIQRDGVPFPALIEALAMLFTCEILRESDLRFPNAYGSAISILGALILGEAAVSAGIVSPIMIIVISLSFITSLIFTETEIINAMRHYRFIFLFLTATYGIVGIVIGLMYFLIRVNGIYSFGKPYFFPISPFSKIYFNKTIIQKDIGKKRRSKMIAQNDLTKESDSK